MLTMAQFVGNILAHQCGYVSNLSNLQKSNTNFLGVCIIQSVGYLQQQ